MQHSFIMSANLTFEPSDNTFPFLFCRHQPIPSQRIGSAPTQGTATMTLTWLSGLWCRWADAGGVALASSAVQTSNRFPAVRTAAVGGRDGPYVSRAPRAEPFVRGRSWARPAKAAASGRDGNR